MKEWSLKNEIGPFVRMHFCWEQASNRSKLPPGAIICFGLTSIRSNSTPSLVWSRMKQPKSPWQQIARWHISHKIHTCLFKAFTNIYGLFHPVPTCIKELVCQRGWQAECFKMWLIRFKQLFSFQRSAVIWAPNPYLAVLGNISFKETSNLYNMACCIIDIL